MTLRIFSEVENDFVLAPANLKCLENIGNGLPSCSAVQSGTQDGKIIEEPLLGLEAKDKMSRSSYHIG